MAVCTSGLTLTAPPIGSYGGRNRNQQQKHGLLRPSGPNAHQGSALVCRRFAPRAPRKSPLAETFGTLRLPKFSTEWTAPDFAPLCQAWFRLRLNSFQGALGASWMMDVRHFDPIFLFASLHKKRGPPWLFGVEIVSLTLSFFPS